ncbi:MAG TPA: hypothetical protein DC000_05465 [Clostridiales bacterium]|nr:hypothetical protein [Clostridiales bacterium]
MIYELRSKKYFDELIKNHGIKENLSYLETNGLAYTLKIVLEEAINKNQDIITDGIISNVGDYKYHYERFIEPLLIRFDNEHCLEAEGYCITMTGKVIIKIINYDIVIALDVTMPYYSNSSIHIYDSVLNLEKLTLSYINEVIYK